MWPILSNSVNKFQKGVRGVLHVFDNMDTTGKMILTPDLSCWRINQWLETGNRQYTQHIWKVLLWRKKEREAGAFKMSDIRTCLKVTGDDPVKRDM